MNTKQKIQLCINADDFGFSTSISSGILEMIQQGLVSSTSVMIQNADEKQMKLLSEQQNVSVGLHFNLASTKNYCTPFLNSPFKIAQQFYLKKLTLSSLEKELEAQYNQLSNLYDKKITHLDTHQHIHIIPKVAALLSEFAAHHHIDYVRLGKEVSPTSGIKKWLFNNSAKALKNSLPIFGLNLMGEQFTADKIKTQFDYLKKQQTTKALWIVHPGYETIQTDFVDSYNKQRENEMHILNGLKEFIYLNAQVVPLNQIRTYPF
jgi:predicted glycoside hydrolase/deacetylase ChbG (UPF0249 family)